MDEKILMYIGEGEGWANTKALTSQDIKEDIDKTDPKYLKTTKVSIPSPFARFDLVKNAFINVARGRNVSKRDELLVSHALDVAQLYFEGSDFKVIQWDAIASPKDLNANDQQKLYGKTLSLYVRSEKLGLNNEENSTIYILATEANDPIGCTSPVSLFIPTPNIKGIMDRGIMIDGDKKLFDEKPRPLYLRDENFVRYIFALTYLFIDKGDDRMKGFCEYVESQKPLLRKLNDSLYTSVSRKEEVTSYYNSLHIDSEKQVRICGEDIRMRNKEDETLQVESSDFVIKATKPASQKPLVLSNNFMMPNATYFGNVKWDKKKHMLNYAYGKDDNKIMGLYADLGQVRKQLPGTNTNYEDGWLCESDFLEDCLIQLPYVLDGHFHSVFTSKDKLRSYLLPIKPKYFDYFSWQDLIGSNGGERALSIEETKSDGKKVSEVVVTLKIPVTKGHVILKKTYFYEATAREAINCPIFADDIQLEAKGKIVTASKVALTIFPFAKLPHNNHYRIQLVSDISNRDFDISLRAYNSDGEVQFEPAKEFKRGHHKYYGISSDIDYFDIVYSGEKNQIHAFLIPDWSKALKGGATKFRFGFDFGTSNSHIAVAELNSEGTPEMKKEAITIEKSIVSTISPTSATPLQVVAPQEFLPLANSADTVKFPFRTILAYAKTEKFDEVDVHGLLNAYIPFSFGKKRLNINNKVEENLKWSKGSNDSTPKYSAYIEELILIAYAYALENDGDIEKCEAVWTYPLSMDKKQIKNFNEEWGGYFEKYFGSDNVKRISESIAPYIYYSQEGRAHNTFGLSIDIGGGTCDVVIIKNNNEQKVTSFRFAADVIFGQGYACDNNMIQNHIFGKSGGYLTKLRHLKQVEEQKQKNDKENLVSEIGQLEELLTRAVEKGESASTASTILFSLENNPIFASFAESKRSYNRMLSKDENFIILFIYFYAAIIYYLTQLLVKLGCEHPKYIIFSGTGSKMLDIIEKAGAGVDDLTANMIGFFSESKLCLNEKEDRFKVEIESKEPKQLTAKGAIYHDIDKVKKAVSNITKTADDCENIIGYTLKDGTAIDNIEMLAKPEIEKEIVDDVKRFNAMFVDFCKKYKIVDEYECNEDDYKIFCNEINRGIDVFFKDEVGNRGEETEFSDVPFFFPIKYIIAELLKTLGKSES